MKFLLAAFTLGVTLSAYAAEKRIVLVAGKPSHPPGMHEFRAGSLLLKKCLDTVSGVSTVVYSNGWPEASSALDGADAIVIYADGGASLMNPEIPPEIQLG